MRLRTHVSHVQFNSSSSEGEEAEDGCWQPDSGDEDAGGTRIARPAPALVECAPRPQNLTHVELACALLDAEVAHTAAPKLQPADLTADWMRDGGLSQPVVVDGGPGVDEALGMKMPAALRSDGTPASLVLPRLLNYLPADTPVPNFDVATQSENEPLALLDFVAYFSDFRRDHLLNVVSLSLAGTRLEEVLSAPQVVREADLVASAWPPGTSKRPEVQLYVLASPSGSFTDFHLDFGGSSVWYRIVTGRKVFMVAPPTPHNLRAFVRWASSSRQSREFLGAALEDVHRFTVTAGQLLLIPGGWPHAVFTPEDSVVVGGNFVHAANLALQCLVCRVEDRLSVQAAFRYPNFRALCWYAARCMCSRLPAAEGEEEQAARDAARLKASRLNIKLRLAGEGTQAAVGDAAAPGEADGNLRFILSALSADAEAGQTSLAPAAAADQELGEEPEDEEAAEPADDSAAEEPGEEEGAAGRGTDAEAPEGTAAPLLEELPPAGPPLTGTELAELAVLYSQLKLWLAQAKNNERDAGAPFDMAGPRILLSRLRLRLRAAGATVVPLEDTFDEAGAPRVRMRLRERVQVEPAEGDTAGPVPEELRDDFREPRIKNESQGGKASSQGVKRAAPPGVRDRLSKKLGLGKGKPFRR